MVKLIALLLLLGSYVSARDLNGALNKAKNTNSALQVNYPAVEGDLLGLRMPRIGVKWPVNKGSLWLSLGTQHWMYIYPKFGKVTGFPILLSGDYSMDAHLTFGLYAGYYRPQYNEPYGSDRYSSYLKSYVGGVKLSFHFTDLFNNAFHEVLNLRKWDLYASLSAGIVHYTWAVDPKYQEYRDFTPVTFPMLGLVVGARYLVLPKLAVFAEAGRGVFGYVGFGVATKVMK